MAECSEESAAERLIDLCSVRGVVDGLFGPISCRVVNMYSDKEFPWKFVYPACSHRSHPAGNRCLRSRKLGTTCHSSANTIIVYHFVLYLMDSSVEIPIGVTVFDEISSFLGLSASEFHAKGNEEQLDIICKCAVVFPRVKVSIRGGDSLYLHRLSYMKPEPAVAVVPKTFHRGASSSKAAGNSGKQKHVSYDEFAEMKRSLNEVYELITGPSASKLKPGSPNPAAHTFAQTEVTSANRAGSEGSGSTAFAYEGSLFCTMSRKELQSLCKKYCIPANKTTAFMIEALELKFRQMGDPVED